MGERRGRQVRRGGSATHEGRKHTIALLHAFSCPHLFDSVPFVVRRLLPGFGDAFAYAEV